MTREKELTPEQKIELDHYGTLQSKLVSKPTIYMDAESALRFAKRAARETGYSHVVTIFVAPDGDTVTEMGRVIAKGKL